MHVSVAIVGYRNPEDIRHCLAALGRSSYEDFSVVICENGGADAFAALKAILPQALPGGQAVQAIEASGNIGFAGGVNVCLAAAPTADAWWVLNPDTLPEADAMSAMVERLRKGDCHAVGCTVELSEDRVQSHGGVWQSWVARAVSMGHGDDPKAAVDADEIERRQDYLNGASMMVGRRFLETIGPMREEYFLYCEEVEWCLRAKARGLHLGYAPGARVLHLQGTTTGAGGDARRQPRMPVYLSARNQMLLTRDCFPARYPIVVATAFVFHCLRFGRRGAWAQLGYALSGWGAGVLNRRGPPAWLSSRA